MKKYQAALPGVLLLSYLVYSTFISINLAHSVILFSLAGLFGYSQYVSFNQKPNAEKEIEGLRLILEQSIKANKESVDARFNKLEDEVGKVSISLIQRQAPSSSSSVKSDKKFVF